MKPLRGKEPTALVVGAAAPIPAYLRQLAEKELPEPTDLPVGAYTNIEGAIRFGEY